MKIKHRLVVAISVTAALSVASSTLATDDIFEGERDPEEERERHQLPASLSDESLSDERIEFEPRPKRPSMLSVCVVVSVSPMRRDVDGFVLESFTVDVECETQPKRKSFTLRASTAITLEPGERYYLMSSSVDDESFIDDVEVAQ